MAFRSPSSASYVDTSGSRPVGHGASALGTAQDGKDFLFVTRMPIWERDMEVVTVMLRRGLSTNYKHML
jgi:hypothetical protein